MADYVRTVKTSSGATAVQIVRYEKRKRVIVSHIGSAHTDEDIASLKEEAGRKIEATSLQKNLFGYEEKKPSPVLVVNKSEYLGDRHTFLYDVINQLFSLFQFHLLDNKLLLDLTLMRIIEPVSKLESLEYLSEMFGILYPRGHLYEAVADFAKLKEDVERKVIRFAQKNLHFDFSLVFYDVTTLYFESFREDEDKLDEEGNVIEKGLRRDGFGKEIKHGQPIILIGLMVNNDGFPISYEVFEGNTFEGDTFIPSILSFKQKHTIQTLTIVADAAMISFDNVQKLNEHKLSYIVGAGTANLKLSQIKEISNELIGKTERHDEELQKRDKATYRIETERGSLICDFSFKRYQKDTWELKKQIARAENLVKKNTDGKKAKFLTLKSSKKENGKNKEKIYELNTELIEKTKLVLGIKGYYTNLFDKDENITNTDIVNHYHNLWRVEKAFRIAKNDLQMRPIYHFKKQSIEAHVLICFMALTICKYMELQTGKSTKRIVKILRGITEAHIRNELTGEITVMRKKIPEDIEQLWKTLLKPNLSH